MLAHQQEAPTARKCGQQQLCRLEMLSCNVGTSAGSTDSQEVWPAAVVQAGNAVL